MKIYLDDESMVEMQCENYSKFWVHCFLKGIHDCSPDGCRHWKSKDWLCKVMCE